MKTKVSKVRQANASGMLSTWNGVKNRHKLTSHETISKHPSKYLVHTFTKKRLQSYAPTREHFNYVVKNIREMRRVIEDT